MFVTSSGRIGSILQAEQDLSIDLTELQRNMAQKISNKDEYNFTRYRAPKNNKGRSDLKQASFGYLDGDFLEQLLSIDPEDPILKDILRGDASGDNEPEKLQKPLDYFRKILESLQSIH